MKLHSNLRFIRSGLLALCLALTSWIALPALAWAQEGGVIQDNYDGHMYWRGMVDGVVDLHIQGRKVTPVVRSGSRPYLVSYRFYTSLPRRSVRVHLSNQQGRGRMSVVRQPTRSNNYTAVVRITDSYSGRSSYRFELDW